MEQEAATHPRLIYLEGAPRRRGRREAAHEGRDGSVCVCVCVQGGWCVVQWVTRGGLEKEELEEKTVGMKEIGEEMEG